MLVKLTELRNGKLEYLGQTKMDAVPAVGDSVFWKGPKQLWVFERHWTIYTGDEMVELFLEDHYATKENNESKKEGQ